MEKAKSYSEVVEILKNVEEEKLEKIPFEVIKLIKNNADPTYKPQISADISLEEQNLQDQTYAILAWIASKYWGEDLNRHLSKSDIKNLASNKNRIENEAINKESVIDESTTTSDIINDTNTETYKNNTETDVESIPNASIENESYSEEHIEESSENSDTTETVSVYNDIDPTSLEINNKLPAVIHHLHWYEQLKNAIIKFFKKIFKRNNLEEGVEE